MIDLDEEALAEAAKVLGTTTKKDTVNKALREAVARLRRIDAIREAQAMAARGEIDLDFLDDLQAAEKAAVARHETRTAQREASQQRESSQRKAA